MLAAIVHHPSDYHLHQWYNKHKYRSPNVEAAAKGNCGICRQLGHVYFNGKATLAFSKNFKWKLYPDQSKRSANIAEKKEGHRLAGNVLLRTELQDHFSRHEVFQLVVVVRRPCMASQRLLQIRSDLVENLILYGRVCGYEACVKKAHSAKSASAYIRKHGSRRIYDKGLKHWV